MEHDGVTTSHFRVDPDTKAFRFIMVCQVA